MTTLLADMNRANGNGNKCDDLTKIRGIGRAKQQWLRESLKIYTFQDLANLPVDHIESALKAEWHTVSRREIQGWIAQAQKLVTVELFLQPFMEVADVDIEANDAEPAQENLLPESIAEFVDTESDSSVAVAIQDNPSSESVVESLSVESVCDNAEPTQENLCSESVAELVDTESDSGGAVTTQENPANQFVEESATVEEQENLIPIGYKNDTFHPPSPHPPNPPLVRGDFRKGGSKREYVPNSNSIGITPAGNNGEWQSLTSFRVEFQSRQIEGQLEEQRITVHCLESDEVQDWSNLESDCLQQWILDRISAGIPASSEAETPVLAPLVSVEIEQIRAVQPPHSQRLMVAQKGNRVFPHAISSYQPLALEVAFSLSGLNAANLTKKQVAYCAQFYIRDRMTGETTHLGDAAPGTLIEGQLSYTARLDETILKPGVYRLQVSVELQDVPSIPGNFKVPLLQVM
jgi:hypothetical protein